VSGRVPRDCFEEEPVKCSILSGGLVVTCACRADVQFLPISGLFGHNMKERLPKIVCPWWDGPCLFEALDAVELPTRDPKGPFR
jgi:translation elongation factor EF-1alpha